MKKIIAGIPIIIQKKKVKNLTLKIKAPDGQVVVSAPTYVRDSDIERFITDKQDWIIKHTRRFSEYTELEYVEGETIYIRGVPYVLKISYCTGWQKIFVENGLIHMSVRETSTAEQRRKLLLNWMRDDLSDRIGHYMAYWTNLTGLYPRDMSVRYMTARWGSCNTLDRTVTFSLRLAEKSDYALEYVILHELAHLQEANHSRQFYSVIEQYMPDWKQRKAELKLKPTLV